jgi:two-component system sensor histidine kinase YcbA
MRENLYILLLMLLTVPIAGELKFHPFDDEFRVSFGTTAFFFFLLWMRRIPSALAGILAGNAVILFRIFLDWLTVDGFQWVTSFQLHLPAFFFYAIYAFLFSLFRVNRLHHRPLLVGLLGTAAEIVANMAELALRSPAPLAVMTFPIVGQITVIAVIRSFFVLSFFNMIQLRQAKLMEEQQRVRSERMLLLISNLYEESIQLKKTLTHVEEVTRDCYDLYRQLKDSPFDGADEFAPRALRIAGQVHEIKKDNQRIYAGLSKMISDENAKDYMSLQELVEIVVRSNDKYARLLGKEVSFVTRVDTSSVPCHIYTTLSLLNNLVANAVEAIESKGTVAVSVCEQGEWVEFRVSDDGPGIAVKDKELLFKPGFTTKFDASGRASTGIGLSYVRELAERLNGTITVRDDAETVFVLRLPLRSLVQKGG